MSEETFKRRNELKKNSVLFVILVLILVFAAFRPTSCDANQNNGSSKIDPTVLFAVEETMHAAGCDQLVIPTLTPTQGDVDMRGGG